jgi:putative tricarboxylic transport membrane protein
MNDIPQEARPLARSDLWSGVVFVGVGLGVLVESWRMPRLEERGIDPWTVPGLVPGVLGLVLAVLGAVLALRGWRESRGQTDHTSIIGRGDARIRLVTALGLNLVYALLLVGRLPYWLATFVYLAAFMAIFVLEPRRSGAAKRALLILAVATAMTAGTVYLFETLFLVRLP